MERQRVPWYRVVNPLVLAVEVLLTALTWLVLDRLGEATASLPVTLVVWTFCLTIHSAPVRAAFAARSPSGRLTFFVVLGGIAIWAATCTTHLPAIFPMVMGIATMELAERDSSWRTAVAGLLTLLLGTAAMEWCVETGLVPTAFSTAGNHRLAVVLALFGILLIFRGFGQARQAVALRAELAHEQALRHAELRHAATHDALTGLLSRRGLEEVLAGPVGRSGGLALVYLDLDGFKAVNDEHGHALGDDLLTQVATRFAGIMPGHGVLARVGGDEFLAVVPELPTQAQASDLAQRLQASLSEPVLLRDDLKVCVGVSVGLSWSAAPPDDLDLLMREADHRMYQDKKASLLSRTYP